MENVIPSKQQEEGKDRLVFWLILTLYSLIASHGIFDRYPVFHDEIINTFKANELNIFDYAVRPFYYGINTIASYQFGSDTIALVFLGMLFYIGTGICLYYLGLTVGISGASFFIPIFFLCFSESFSIGIRAMPHGPAGFFLALTILAVCRLIMVARNQRQLVGATSFVIMSAILALGTHVTNLGFLFSLGIILMISSLFILVRRGSAVLMTHSEREFCLGAAACDAALLISLFLYAILYKIFYGTDFLSVLFGGIRNISDTTNYGTYHKPFGFYFEHLWLNYWPILLLGLLPLFAVAWLRMKSERDITMSSAMRKYLFIWLGSMALLALTLLIISISSWKFVRVFCGFTPLVAIFAGLSVSTAYSILKMGRSSTYWVLLIAAGVSLLVSGMKVGDTMSSLRESRTKLFHKYYAVHAALMLLPERTLLFVGPRDYSFYSSGRYALNSGKTLLQWQSANEILNEQDGIKHLVVRMRARKVKSLFLSKTAEKLSDEQIAKFHKELRHNGADLVYSWRGIAEIWRLYE